MLAWGIVPAWGGPGSSPGRRNGGSGPWVMGSRRIEFKKSHSKIHS